MRAATADLSWLLTRGYGATSSIKLVGDRHRLDERQRMAALRCACSDADAERRRVGEAMDLAGGVLRVDTYNVLTTVESALAGAVVLRARDGCYRDIASMHGTFRSTDETPQALHLLCLHVAALRPATSYWLLDRPVSNSGRLAQRMRAIFHDLGLEWEVELVNDPDAELRTSNDVVATADSGILDRGPRWYNLARAVVEGHVPDAWIVDLS